MNNPRVFMLTAVHNQIEYTKKFLKSLDKQDYHNIDVTIVDDGSNDGTYEFIKKNYPKVRLIKGDGNLWWTGSLYRGIRDIVNRSSENDYILTINNDCTFNRKYVSSLVKVAKNDLKFIVGSCVLDNNTKKVWDAGVNIKWNYLSFSSDYKRNKYDIKHNMLCSKIFDTLSSKGTLFPISLIRKIGNFDKKNFPHYLSDYDYFYVAKKSGYIPVVSYKSLVMNKIERTGMGDSIKQNMSFREYYNLLFSRKSKVNIVDHFKFVKKHCPTNYLALNYLVVVGKAFHYLLNVYPFVLIPKLVKVLKS
ncbi:MAG: glycosyltransferase family 2 protein [bacterium]|nr:MAG: glycosyltransferase family 2 protein [bacterium]